MHRRGIGSRCGHNNRVGHSAFFLQNLSDSGNCRRFLSDGNIDAEHRFAAVVKFFLIDDGIDGNGGFTRLTVTDNQLALTSTNWNHGIYGLDSCLKGFIYRLAENNAWGFALQGHIIAVSFNWAAAI